MSFLLFWYIVLLSVTILITLKKRKRIITELTDIVLNRGFFLWKQPFKENVLYLVFSSLILSLTYLTFFSNFTQPPEILNDPLIVVILIIFGTLLTLFFLIFSVIYWFIIVKAVSYFQIKFSKKKFTRDKEENIKALVIKFLAASLLLDASAVIIAVPEYPKSILSFISYVIVLYSIFLIFYILWIFHKGLTRDAKVSRKVATYSTIFVGVINFIIMLLNLMVS